MMENHVAVVIAVDDTVVAAEPAVQQGFWAWEDWLGKLLPGADPDYLGVDADSVTAEPQ